MQIVNKKPIPMYEVKCHECGSVFQYKKSEVPFTGFINCPVCGCSNWANTTLPVYNSEEQNNDESTMNQWIPCSERLPEPVTPSQRREWFITSNQYGSVTLTCYEFESSPFKEGWQTDMTILAWMPLPEPYKIDG